MRNYHDLYRRYSQRIRVILIAGLTAAAGLAEAKDASERGPSGDERLNTPEALRTGDNMLLFQEASGGWRKNTDMSKELTAEQVEALRRHRSRVSQGQARDWATLDNGATFSQINHLARLCTARDAAGIKDERNQRYKAAVIKGLDYLLAAQYANGGWPQVPGGGGYQKYITFNDGVVANALGLLQDVAEKKADFAFVDDARREKAAAAVKKGIECILKCQVLIDGKRTVWCQQHDEKTFEPRGARAFEPAALTAAESVGVARFLMRIDNPSAEVVEAVQGAVAWFAGPAKLTGIRQVRKEDKSKPNGWDKIIVKDPAAPPLWARLYYIGTLGGPRWKLADKDVKVGQPIFGDRDGKVYTSLHKIIHERRTGYAWYGQWPAKLIEEDYPAWQKKWSPDHNVLSP